MVVAALAGDNVEEEQATTLSDAGASRLGVEELGERLDETPLS